MTTARAILIVGVMLAVVLLVHAYLTRPPRYQIVHAVEGSRVERLDTLTGEVLSCHADTECKSQQ